MSKFKISLDKQAIFTRVEMDGEVRRDVIAVEIQSGLNGRDGYKGLTTLTLTIVPESVEVTGDDGIIRYRRPSRWQRLRQLAQP